MNIIKDKYNIYSMPSHKHFLETIGFKQNNSYKGFKAINGYIKQVHDKEQKIIKKYLYPGLDYWDLLDKLESLPTEEFKKIKKEQLQYPWILKDVKTRA